MAGIRDKLALLFIAFNNWPEQTSGKKDQQQQDSQHTHKGDAYAGKEKGSEGGEASAAVQEDNADVASFRMRDKAIVGEKTAGFSTLKYSAGVFHGRGFIDCRDPAGICGKDFPVVGDQDGEVTGFIGHLRGKRIAGVFNILVGFRKEALVFGEDGKRIFRVLKNVQIIQDVYCTDNGQEHQK